MAKTTKNTSRKGLPRPLLGEMLSFFFPIHYRVGMELETRMCQGRISRQQAAIIWMIESEVGGNGWMRRRIIEQHLKSWFETSNSHVSQLLRDLAKPPLSMVVQMENPASGREKVVALTPEGRAFFKTMIDAGLDFFTTQFEHVGEDEMRWGINYLALAFRPPEIDDKGRRQTPRLDPPPPRIRK
ncbi:MAG: MarR family transcriptional regulator [Rhodocyclaceae bacterium]|jgi:DNA-binding MarR family transcriptional regulator|nr:MarR family transcriptional regulator [Rhodocyclaceae bacterium]